MKNTIRLLNHMESHRCDISDRDSVNAFIRKVWETRGNATANFLEDLTMALNDHVKILAKLNGFASHCG